MYLHNILHLYDIAMLNSEHQCAIFYISVLSHSHPHVKYVLLAQTTNDSYEKVHPISEDSPNNRAVTSYSRWCGPSLHATCTVSTGVWGTCPPTPTPLQNFAKSDERKLLLRPFLDHRYHIFCNWGVSKFCTTIISCAHSWTLHGDAHSVT